MVNQAQFKAVMGWIPRNLGGTSYPVLLARDYARRQIVPSISVGVISAGNIVSPFKDGPIRTVHDEHGDLVTHWGHNEDLHLSLHLRSYDPDELQDMFDGMKVGLWSTRLNLSWELDKVRLTDVIARPKNFDTTRDDRVDKQKKIYRSVIDIVFEYEFSYVEDAPTLHRFGWTVGVNDVLCKYGVTKQLYIMDANWSMNMLAKKAQTAGYQMGLKIVSP